MAALLALLREDAVHDDAAASPPSFGREAIVAIFEHRCVAHCSCRPTATWVNGSPAVELRDPAGELHRLLVLDVDGDRIAHIGAFRIPKEGQSLLT